MKKILLSFVFFAVIMIGTVSTTQATETFYVRITLSDTCSPSGYDGYYCVRLKLTYYGSDVCTAINCRILPGTNCYAFSCDFTPVAANIGYAVTFVDAARYPSGDCYTTVGSTTGIGTWEDISDPSCIVATLTVTL